MHAGTFRPPRSFVRAHGTIKCRTRGNWQSSQTCQIDAVHIMPGMPPCEPEQADRSMFARSLSVAALGVFLMSSSRPNQPRDWD